MRKPVLLAFALALFTGNAFAGGQEKYPDAVTSFLETTMIADRSVQPSSCGHALKLTCVYTSDSIKEYLLSDQVPTKKFKPDFEDEFNGIKRLIYTYPFAGKQAKISAILAVTKGKSRMYILSEIQDTPALQEYLQQILQDIQFKKK